MNNSSNFPKNFLDVLIKQANNNSNPFNKTNYSQDIIFQSKYSPFGFYEDSLDKEIRCPICLGRVSAATRPSSCLHIFCSFCINKWKKSSKKCPMCRKIYLYLIPVDIMNPSYNFQGNLFVLPD
jgi:hypothetical protein